MRTVTPLEMIKVRQQTEMVLNKGQKRKYHGLINTASIIVRQEGYIDNCGNNSVELTIIYIDLQLFIAV